MSDQNINQQESREQSSEVLLALDKEKKKIQAVKGIREDGELETLDASKENQNQFMRVDKHGDLFSNFFSNFQSQLKNPTNFKFFIVPEFLAVEIVRHFQEIVDFVPDKIKSVLMKQYEVKTESEVEHKQQNENNMETTQTTPETSKYRFEPEQIDWGTMSNYGLSKERLEKMNLIEPLLKGYKTDLVSLSFSVGMATVRTDARLSLRQGEDGKVSLNIHGIRREPPLHYDFLGHKFTEKDKENLLKTGNMGRVVDLVNPKTQEKIPSIISVDRLTNELVALRTDWIKIPPEVKGVKLNEEQKQTLMEGKPLYIEGMISKKGTSFDAKVQFNADKRYVEFLFDEKPTMKQTQKETNDIKESSKSEQKVSENKKQQEQQEKPKAPAKSKGRKM